MSFLWMGALAALALLPVLVWVYLRALRGNAASAALHPDLRLLAQATAAPRPLRRHLPALLYLAAIAVALLALARPTAPLPLPDNRTTIMLSLDVSGSMRADDIAPTRFEAMQEAARAFVRALPEGARVGLATFSGYAVLNTPPTTEHEEVLAAIDTLSMNRGTAIGDGLMEAVRALPGRGEKDKLAPAELPPAAIVLLSDGRSNRGMDPTEAAQEAKKLAVKVYTVGLGTQDGQLEFSGQYRTWAGFDEEALKGIATATGGRYYAARSAGQLNTIYRDLGRSLGWTIRPREVTGFLTALAALLVLGSFFASERLARRVV